MRVNNKSGGLIYPLTLASVFVPIAPRRRGCGLARVDFAGFANNSREALSPSPVCLFREELMSRKFGILSTAAIAALSIAMMSAPTFAAETIIGLITKTNTNPFFVKM